MSDSSMSKTCATSQAHNVLVVGLTTLDIIDYVDSYPVEDTASHVTHQRWVKGGNAANTACVLSQLGTNVDLYSSLSAMPQYETVLDELRKFNVNLDHCETHHDKHFPVCSCIVNLQNGLRTFFYSPNDLPWISFDGFKKLDFTKYDLVHFEGRGFPATGEMIQYLLSIRKCQSPILSCEVKLPDELPSLEKYFFPAADILFVSKDVAKLKGFQSGSEAAVNLADRYGVAAEYIICPWGEQGAAGVRREHSKTTVVACPASVPAQVVDTLGAGDTFIAGALEAFLNGGSLEGILQSACALAGKKCSQIGFENLT